MLWKGFQYSCLRKSTSSPSDMRRRNCVGYWMQAGSALAEPSVRHHFKKRDNTGWLFYGRLRFVWGLRVMLPITHLVPLNTALLSDGWGAFLATWYAIPYFENASSLATVDASIHATKGSFYFCKLTMYQTKLYICFLGYFDLISRSGWWSRLWISWSILHENSFRNRMNILNCMDLYLVDPIYCRQPFFLHCVM